ncbi:hypothetical protein LEP1GSC172_3209 [Leptospira noguchii]|uniref:Uncharacterized protein n=1 Tax=Leptospira noguchii TaxID=28182 RepID=M6V9H4_9LEPT|nr:hypothetical protein LEP1GSC172_3209 [Leptospira noguchii]
MNQTNFSRVRYKFHFKLRSKTRFQVIDRLIELLKNEFSICFCFMETLD